MTTSADHARPSVLSSEALALALLAVAAAIGIAGGMTGGEWWELVLLVLGAIGGGILEVQIADRLYISGIIVFSVIAAAYLGPLPAFLVPTIADAVSGTVHHVRRAVILRNCACAALPSVLGALLLQAWLPVDLGSWGTPLAIAAATLFLWLANIALSAVFEVLSGLRSAAAFARLMVSYGPSIVLSCGFAGAVGAVYATSPAVGLLFTFVLMAALLYLTRQASSLLERAEEIAALAESRRVLAADAADAEERERRRIAERLHDDALQSLLAARQDIRSVARGDVARLDAADTAVQAAVAELRDTVAQLHPAPTLMAGVGAMLRAVAEAEARRGGYSLDVSGPPELRTVHDRLLLAIGRELMANVTRHAEAHRVRVRADTADGYVALEVVDDGRGMTGDDRERALATGHVGLTTLIERVEALGGSVTIASPADDGCGAAVTVRLPL